MNSPKLITLSITALLIISAKAYADLSPNPWLEPNDKEAIESIYHKKHKNTNTGRTQYTPDAAPEIDLNRKTTYKTDEPKETEGIGAKLKGLFSKNKEEKLPEPPKSVPPQNLQQESPSSPSIVDEDTSGLRDTVNAIKRGINNTWAKTNRLYNRAQSSLKSNIKNLSRKLK